METIPGHTSSAFTVLLSPSYVGPGGCRPGHVRGSGCREMSFRRLCDSLESAHYFPLRNKGE